MLGRWLYILSEAVNGLRRNMLMTVAVVLSGAVSLLLLGGSILINEQVDAATDEWYGKIEVSIFLCDGRKCDAITTEQQETLRADLEANPLVERVYYESKAEAFESFKEMFRDQPEFVEAVDANTLPASFRVKLTDPSQFDSIRQQYSQMPGVEEIIDQREVLKSFFAVMSAVRVGALSIAIILIAAVCVLIANTIRVAAFARRDQTAIMKLVGASNWYIRLPFILEGMLAGLVGAVVASVILVVAVLVGVDSLRENIQFMPFISWRTAAWTAPWLLGAGVVIAALSSLLSLRRFLDV